MTKKKKSKGQKIVKQLKRKGKFQLSGGKMMFAPRYPQWLDSPGYWDDLYFHDEKLSPVFSYVLLDSVGAEIISGLQHREWWPGKSKSVYKNKSRLTISEERFISEDSVLWSKVTIKNRNKSSIKLNLVAWSRQIHDKKGPRCRIRSVDSSLIHFRRVEKGERSKLETNWHFFSDRTADTWEVSTSEHFGSRPLWNDTPYANGWDGKLNNKIYFNPDNSWGVIWPALHFELEIPPGKSKSVSVAMSISKANTIVHIEDNAGKARRKSQDAWADFFTSTPTFTCSDSLWTNLYNYRWYLLRQCLKRGGDSRQPFDGICEGTEIFHQPISYSTPPITFDLRWHHDPMLAKNNLLNFFEMQEPDGRLPGALHHDRFRPEFFYHADWGRAVERLLTVHPDGDYVEEIYPHLKKYGYWLLEKRDPENSGMISIVNHMETGQEFNSRYIAARSDFDGDGWDKEFFLKGIDSTVYSFFIFETLENLSRQLGKNGDRKFWQHSKGKTAQAILEVMWNEKQSFFSDVIYPELRRTGAHSATNFYPFLTGLTAEAHLPMLKKYLLNKEAFWTPIPVATQSRQEKYFSTNARWKGKTRNCTWNGRIWPMCNSHIIECLAKSGVQDGSMLHHAARLLLTTALLHDADGDGVSLSSYEHYHPVNGKPGRYRGIDDYLHSWMIDLIIRYVVGFRPDPANNAIRIDPLPMDITLIKMHDLYYRNSMYDITNENGLIHVRRDGKEIIKGQAPLNVNIDS